MFKTAFLSGTGSKLNNHDYFTYVELDEFVCYVLADGLNGLGETESTKLAIETIILKFQGHPSIKKETVSSYLHTANEVLFHSGSKEWLKASVTVLVSDHASIRYGFAGSTELRIYRDGNMIEQNRDMSLSQELLGREKVSGNIVSKHEECNNLYGCLDQEQGFSSDISERVGLVNEDIITLYTRGVWENVDEGELDSVFSEAKDEPQESLDNVEELLLAGQPEQLENYMLAALFVDKIYLDPGRAREIKKRVIAAVIAILMILCACLVTWAVKRVHRNAVDNMSRYYADTVNYIRDQNFVRAGERCKEALKGTKELCDKKETAEFTVYLKLIEAVNEADDTYGNGEYGDARAGYVIARERSRYTDRVADSYIEKRLSGITNYLSVLDYVQLGDSLTAQGDYVRAGEKYLEAKWVAIAAYYPEGRTNAMKASEAMYTAKDKAEEEEEKAVKAKAADEIGTAELALKGGKAFEKGDYTGANAFYTMATGKYQELGDKNHAVTLQVKIQSGNAKTEELTEKGIEAGTYLSLAEETEAVEDMLKAKEQYLSAENIYKNLDQEEKVTEVNGILDVVNTEIEQQVEEKEKIAAQGISEEDGSVEEEPQGKDSKGEAVKAETGPGVEVREGEA